MSPSSSIATALKKVLDTTLYSTFLYRRLYGLDSFIGQVRGVKFMCPKVYIPMLPNQKLVKAKKVK